MYSLHEKVVYPGHGVAEVSRIFKKNIAGRLIDLIELTFLNKDMTILVPTDNLESSSVRKVSSHEKINDIFKLLSKPLQRVSHDIHSSSWSKRSRDYQCKLRSGNLDEICKIYRDLKSIAIEKELSFGEKNLLHKSESLLVEEISVVKKMGEEQAIEHLRSLFQYPENYSSSVSHVSRYSL